MAISTQNAIDKKKEKVEVCIDLERGHLVKKMFEEYATGLHSMEDLRLMANEDGLRSKRGYELSKSHIEGILGNPFYLRLHAL